MGFENLDQFNRDIQKLSKDLPAEGVQALHQKTAFDIVEGAVLTTPVDTGRLRGGWDVAVGTTKTENIEARDVIDQTGQPTLNEASQNIESIPPFGVCTIHNNVEYVGFVEDGTDRQAPVKMLQRSIDRVGQAIGGGE